jgi:hypothetical protein
MSRRKDPNSPKLQHGGARPGAGRPQSVPGGVGQVMLTLSNETLEKLEPDAARKIRHMVESIVRNRYEIVPVDGSVVLMRAGEPVARFDDMTKAEAVYVDFAYNEAERFEKEPVEIKEYDS